MSFQTTDNVKTACGEALGLRSPIYYKTHKTGHHLSLSRDMRDHHPYYIWLEVNISNELMQIQDQNVITRHYSSFGFMTF